MSALSINLIINISTTKNEDATTFEKYVNH